MEWLSNTFSSPILRDSLWTHAHTSYVGVAQMTPVLLTEIEHTYANVMQPLQGIAVLWTTVINISVSQFHAFPMKENCSNLSMYSLGMRQIESNKQSVCACTTQPIMAEAVVLLIAIVWTKSQTWFLKAMVFCLSWFLEAMVFCLSWSRNRTVLSVVCESQEWNSQVLNTGLNGMFKAFDRGRCYLTHRWKPGQLLSARGFRDLGFPWFYS